MKDCRMVDQLVNTLHKYVQVDIKLPNRDLVGWLNIDVTLSETNVGPEAQEVV